MTSCRCACGQIITMTGPMETWEVPMLAHVRGNAHREWSRLQAEGTPHIYEEHLGSLLGAGRPMHVNALAAGPGKAA